LEAAPTPHDANGSRGPFGLPHSCNSSTVTRSSAIRVAYTALKATGVANDAAQIVGESVHNLYKRTALHTKYTAVDNKSTDRLVPVPSWPCQPTLQLPTLSGACILRKQAIRLSAVMRPVLGLSDGTFSIVMLNEALSASTWMLCVLRVTVGSAQTST